MSAARARTHTTSEASEILTLGARKVAVTHADRVLFPDDGITKGDLVHYYRDVAPYLLPYLVDRPLTLQRWPRGIGGFSFFEKRAPEGMPPWIATTTQPRADGDGDVVYPMAQDAASLVWLANLGSITFHVWMSRVGAIDRPDVLLFDLDPFEGCTVRTLARVASKAREVFAATGLETFVKTTGGKGLHVVAPIGSRWSYEEARAQNEHVARALQKAIPDAVTLERSKAKRPKGTVYIDWAQLGQGKTMVPPFVVRAQAGAPVSMPIAWGEVEALCSSRSSKPTHQAFLRWNSKNVPAILAERGDPWGDAFKARPRRNVRAKGR